MAITAESLKEAWSAIRAKISQAAGSLVLEQSLIQGEVSLSAVVRVRDQMPGLVVRVPSRWSGQRWPTQRLAGVHFERALQENNDVLLPVMLAHEDAATIFAVFAADLASAVSAEGSLEKRMCLLMERTGLWKRFFQQRSGGLSEEEVRGLVGELAILGSLVQARGVDFAMESWKGPAGALHDFHLPNLRIEVKTWINDALPRIFISDPSQIALDAAWPVLISAIQLSSDTSDGSTLPEWVAALCAQMDKDQNVIFEALLADAGYLVCHQQMYDKRYSVRDTVFYSIVEGFPRIDPATIPGGISCLKYALELGALAPFVTASPI